MREEGGLSHDVEWGWLRFAWACHGTRPMTELCSGGQ